MDELQRSVSAATWVGESGDVVGVLRFLPSSLTGEPPEGATFEVGKLDHGGNLSDAAVLTLDLDDVRRLADALLDLIYDNGNE